MPNPIAKNHRFSFGFLVLGTDTEVMSYNQSIMK